MSEPRPGAAPVALVTDSTASLSAEQAAAHRVVVVPLQVVIGTSSYDEGSPEASAGAVAQALKDRQQVSTSRPTPEAMRAVYDRLAEEGVEEIVSVHLSSQMSGTFESAQLAARDCAAHVVPVDSRLVGIGTGFAVLAGAEARAAGASVTEVADAVRERAAATESLFYVDTLEYLRRGGRVGTAAALLGSALAVKPILRIEDGRVGPYERVRTSGRALARLEELAVEVAGRDGGAPVDVGVFHLEAVERADALAEALAARLVDQLQGRPVVLGEVGAVMAAHVGPGMVGVSVSRRAAD